MTGTNPLCKMRAIKLSVGSDRVYIGLGSIGRFRKYGEVYEENLESTVILFAQCRKVRGGEQDVATFATDSLP